MLRGFLALATFALSTTLLGIGAILGGLAAPRSNVPFRLGRVWSRTMLAALGIRPDYEGLEHATGQAPRIFLANHLSSVDIWVLALVLPDTCRFVAKKSLFWFPVLGQAMWVAGFIPIDRGDRTRAIRSLRRAAERIRGGASVILFPEGTRSRDGRLAPFKKGAFHLALEAGVPVVPIAISGTGRVLRPRSIVVTPGPVAVTIGPPIAPEAFADGDVAALMEAARATIASGLTPLERGEATAP